MAPLLLHHHFHRHLLRHCLLLGEDQGPPRRRAGAARRGADRRPTWTESTRRPHQQTALLLLLLLLPPPRGQHPCPATAWRRGRWTGATASCGGEGAPSPPRSAAWDRTATPGEGNQGGKGGTTATACSSRTVSFQRAERRLGGIDRRALAAAASRHAERPYLRLCVRLQLEQLLGGAQLRDVSHWSVGGKRVGEEEEVRREGGGGSKPTSAILPRRVAQRAATARRGEQIGKCALFRVASLLPKNSPQQDGAIGRREAVPVIRCAPLASTQYAATDRYKILFT